MIEKDFHTLPEYRETEAHFNSGDQPLPPEGHPLLKLGQRLADLLDEDQWAECEQLLLEGLEYDLDELSRWKRAAEANIEENVRLRADLDELRHNDLIRGASHETK